MDEVPRLHIYLLTVLVPIIASLWRFFRGSIPAASARSPSMPRKITFWRGRPKTLESGQVMVSVVGDAAAATRRSSVKETSDATDGVVGSHSIEVTAATDRRAARRKTRGDGDGAGDFIVKL